jgi:Putative DNA-binding domain
MNLLAVQRGMRDHLIGGAEEIKEQIRGDAPARLAVYHHAYRAQLLDSLRDTFERVWAWLGDAGFEAAARGYIESHPPRSWTLSDYGDDFDRILAGLYPDEREVAELAWLDWSLRRAFDGRDATPVTAGALSDIDWDRAILCIVPTLRIRSISTNSAAIWTALSEKNAPPAAARLHAPTALRVWRKEFSPHFRAVDSIEQHALLMACDGASFAAICAAIADRTEPARAPEVAGSLLAGWLQDGLIVAVENP